MFRQGLWLWIIGIVFLLACMMTLTRFGGYFLTIMAAITVFGGGVIFYFAGIRRSFHLVLLSLPLSLNLPLIPGHQLLFPSELLVAAFCIAVVLYFTRNTSVFAEWIQQPLTIAAATYLFFMMLSVFFSEILVVSIKSAIIKIMYIVAFYGGGYLYFRNREKNLKFLGYYLVPLMTVVVYVLIRHSEFSFSKEVTGYVTKPFFQDHTIYSAAMAFVLPLVLVQLFNDSTISKGFLLTSFLVLAVALFFAASRAAWLSVLLSFITGVFIYFRFPRRVLLFIALFGSITLWMRADDFMWKLKSNRSDSGARHAGLEEQTKSVANITTDQSNAERINRWKCAWRMFLEKPLIGFGPGTYQFSYFPFQRESEMTQISVKSAYNIAEGRGGTAHNEFLLILSESGLFSALSFLVLVLFTILIAINSCYQPVPVTINLGMLLAFLTFVIHSLFNNFLDTDKTAILFYMSIAYFSATNFHAKNNARYES